MSMPKHQVHLNQQQRQHLLNITSKGKVAVRQFKRSQILLLSDAGYKDQDITERVGVGVATVERTGQKFAEHGLDKAITEQPRPGRQRKLDGSMEAFLIATACSEAPDGRADRLVALGKVEAISDETVRRTLKKTSSSRG